MNKFSFVSFIFFIGISASAAAQNFPVTTISGAYSIYDSRAGIMNGYALSLQHEFGITNRFSLVADASFHDYKNRETYEIDTISVYEPSTNISYGRLYEMSMVKRFLSFPITANIFLMRNDKQTISCGAGTVFQYQLSDNYNYTFYNVYENGSIDMGPYYESYANSNDNGILPDFYYFTANAKATRILTSNFGVSAQVRCMALADPNNMAEKIIYDFALGVFIKSGKKFR